MDLAARKGLCDNVTGVTTNPILLEKAKVACHVKSLAVLANCAFELVRNPTFLQVLCLGGGFLFIYFLQNLPP